MLKTAETVSPPRLRELGTDLLRLSKWQLARCLALPFMAFAAFWIFAACELWALAVLSTVVLSFVTYGSTSHDLVHKNLGLKRLTNDILLSIIEAISLRSGHAYQAVHLNHHGRLLHDDDIESQASRMSLTRALLEGVVFQFRTYRWALRHARGGRSWIIAEGVVVLAIIIGRFAALPWTVIPAIYVGLMIAGSWIIPLVTSYLPHDAVALTPCIRRGSSAVYLSASWRWIIFITWSITCTRASRIKTGHNWRGVWIPGSRKRVSSPSRSDIELRVAMH